MVKLSKKSKKWQPLKSYHQYLIESLKQPIEAAAYLWAILQEENPELQLLKSAPEDILEALGNIQLSPEEIERQKNKLNIFLEQQGKVVIYSLKEWLQKLGLQLTVKAADETFVEQNNSDITLLVFHTEEQYNKLVKCLDKLIDKV